MTYQDTSETSSQQPGQPRRRGSIWKVFGILFGFVVLGVVAYGVGVALRAVRPRAGEAGKPASLMDAVRSISQIAIDPQDGFPDKHKLVICCMGIDDNWTNSDIVYTAGSRTDTLFLLTLDLDARTATMLSIPRDAYVPIAGTRYSDKINAAYATGGPTRTEATIDHWLGVAPNYYIVLNIDATKRMVDALGGVDVDVEHEMDYDDAWGHLHVHLKPGFQHLDGDQAVGFARFRHGNHGPTPEDGDVRRMYRQHVLFKAMIVKAKTFSSVLQANKLIDIGMSCIRTDLTRTQLFDLAALFHNMNPDTDVTTASLVGGNGIGPDGAYVMLVDQKQAKQYVDWLVNGNEAAGRALTPVRITNATTVTGLAAHASTTVASLGFTDTRVSTLAVRKPPATTQIVDSGVPDKAAASELAAALGVPGAQIVRQPNQPNHLGWTAPPDVDVILGSDYAAKSDQQTAENVRPKE